ncbi:hypothetical protein BDK51DRAFT_35173 [Blyttiomyces helicus]|uniref:Uncharacterized protein n=1 Tax=Blyttiomyces helicus TaxID=388810 RepID=A0A4V1IR55_9FUNG|nr:hypothetical protein BDK51DRAFT_35173 [Blyttiomyces helicus]|eukprot:RKO88877.1 hypothetical protein BDK51DRAFT_35173 [Blyttiomyces helicus]
MHNLVVAQGIIGEAEGPKVGPVDAQVAVESFRGEIEVRTAVDGVVEAQMRQGLLVLKDREKFVGEAIVGIYLEFIDRRARSRVDGNPVGPNRAEDVAQGGPDLDQRGAENVILDAHDLQDLQMRQGIHVHGRDAKALVGPDVAIHAQLNEGRPARPNEQAAELEVRA